MLWTCADGDDSANKHKVRSTTQRCGNKTKPLLAWDGLTNQAAAPSIGFGGGRIARATLVDPVDPVDFDGVVGARLDILGQEFHLRPLLFIGRSAAGGDQQRPRLCYL